MNKIWREKNPPHLQLFDAIHEFFITRMNHTGGVIFIYVRRSHAQLIGRMSIMTSGSSPNF
ncbi:hypothetical protein AAZX31_11G020500 [Glycine max]